MKTIYLVRHAKSSWDFPELSDFDRPLNKRGKKNAPEMGVRLQNQGILPDLLMSSPANRAHTTALNIAEKIGYDKDKIRLNRKIYHASEAELLFLINEVEDDFNTLMLFGHNPGFTDLANILGNDWIDNIPTAGVVCLEFGVDSWKEIKPKSGKTLWFDYPKKQPS